MPKIKSLDYRTIKYTIGNTNGYHAYVTFRDGDITQVSLYQGRKQLIISPDDSVIRVLAEIINETLSVIDTEKQKGESDAKR